MPKLSEQKIIKIVSQCKDMYIPHRYGEEVWRAFDWLRRYGGLGNSAQCIVVQGEPGTGKTACAMGYLLLNPVIRGVTVDTRPVAYARLTGGGKRTYRSVAVDLLAAFADSRLLRSETQFSLVRRLGDRVRQQGTEIILLDEANEFVSSSTRRVEADGAEWQKSLLNGLLCGMALIGSGDVIHFVNSNPSLKRRVRRFVEIRPYDWMNAEDRQEFRSLLLAFDHCEPLKGILKPMGLEHPEFAARAYVASGGKVGIWSSIFADAVTLALESGEDQLRVEHFANIFDGLSSGGQISLNPFR